MAIEPNVLAAVVVDELIRNGVTKFVYCPGSRNGPVGFALVNRAERGDVDLHVRLDERSAAFVALGLARGGGKPAAVVTTSGTAVANLLPAVCEADQGQVPLLVLSANRPPEALGTGASQTVEQFGFFDGQVRYKVQVGSAQQGDEVVSRYARSQVSTAVLACFGGFGRAHGPVQVDLPLVSGKPPSIPDVEGPRGRDRGLPWVAVPPRTASGSRTDIDLARPTVVVAGDGADVHEVPADIPLVAEPTVEVEGRVRIHPWALDYLSPRQVVVLGRPTLHRAVSALLERDDVELFVQSGAVLEGIFAGTHANRISDHYRFDGKSPPEWTKQVWDADRIVRECWEECLDQTADTPTGLHVARRLLAAVRPAHLLWVGASNPIRDVGLVADLPAGVRVYSNRGVAGIDGTIASAIGLALNRPTQAVIAFVGDLTFEHDASSLQFGTLERRPDNLTIVVSNDNGGGIFETLEQGDRKYQGAEFGGAFERIYGTPQQTDIKAICQAYGVRYRNGDDGRWMAGLGARHGMEVIEISTRRSSLRDIHAEVRERMNRAMTTVNGIQHARSAPGDGAQRCTGAGSQAATA
ncbi:2-succinyl-5-enolpyruvyl-6-hydroxy-3-cyclohexene-1-carboxylic-acid synthase [Amycolatopsis taiwanensis]|uniref:2-succinyl-5-enolpyruvyl-6-hydroxy-3-cyclohexene-1-carboxylate synthase n=1 Tax=Amycolatopsis taiwanensis TaxID=342230 RepID=A0A9W6R8X6_9PSEU|nr:2-succinyl-5-enolpyruvyl-6-hydroxy-3-cyclohexene-1-carboxylic-acid synthase [Amycolatopsis taiwanensis]GLY71516.1 2-succinyl-5-enolpyruvyl-6-hydroxy-3-cyclohexene-1-carboxylate synthase [Amycolatopsis taiwanensis]